MSKLLVDHLPIVATAPNGVRKIRELVLQLGMRGALVPQDNRDEPATVLLKRIAAERQDLIEKKKMRLPKPLAKIKLEEIPFKLPEGWVWARLDDIGDTNIGLTYSPKDITDHGIPVLRSNNIQNGSLVLSNLVRVSVDVSDRVLVAEGDLLICARNGSRGLVGKAALINPLYEKTAFGAFMAIFRSILNKYVYYFINSPLFRHSIDNVETTTINQITQNNLRSTLIPIPPLPEQHRIVAKIDELMNLCDHLHSQIIEARAVQELIATTLIEQILTHPDGGVFFEKSKEILRVS